jgi:hypothetical protein
MKSGHILFATVLSLSAAAGPFGAARAGTMQYEEASAYEAQRRSYVSQFGVTRPGVPVFTLRDSSWSDTRKSSNWSSTSTAGALGHWVREDVEPEQGDGGRLHAHRHDKGERDFDEGDRWDDDSFEHDDSTTVPLPGSLALMLSGMGLLSLAARRSRLQ